jgi:hypothetical protein
MAFQSIIAEGFQAYYSCLIHVTPHEQQPFHQECSPQVQKHFGPSTILLTTLLNLLASSFEKILKLIFER